MIKRILPVIAGLCVLAVIAMAVALSVGGKGESFTPPPFRFSAAGELTVKNGAADVWLTNPSGSAVWLKVRILDENDNILGESGLIRAGEYVRSVQLTAVPSATANISLKIMAYEPDTYYSAGSARLNTVLTVS